MEKKKIKRGRFFFEEEGGDNYSGEPERKLLEGAGRRSHGEVRRDQCKIGDKKGSGMLLRFFHYDFYFVFASFSRILHFSFQYILLFNFVILLFNLLFYLDILLFNLYVDF